MAGNNKRRRHLTKSTKPTKLNKNGHFLDKIWLKFASFSSSFVAEFCSRALLIWSFCYFQVTFNSNATSTIRKVELKIKSEAKPSRQVGSSKRSKRRSNNNNSRYQSSTCRNWVTEGEIAKQRKKQKKGQTGQRALKLERCDFAPNNRRQALVTSQLKLFKGVRVDCRNLSLHLFLKF